MVASVHAPLKHQLAAVVGGAALCGLPLDAVAQVLVLLEPVLDDLRRQAALALERAPS